jgi:hypothetical protein
MKWYSLIQGFEPEARRFYVSRKGDLEGCEWWHFSEGKRIEKWTSSAWIQSKSVTEDAPPDDGIVNHFGLLIFSSKMRIALENAGISGVQYLPIRVLKSDDTEHPGYSIANALNIVMALNRQESDFSVFPQDYFDPKDRGRISGIRKAVLEQSALQDFHIVRLKEFLEGIYVSELFVNTYNRHRLTGYTFSEVRTTGPSPTG